MTYASLSLTIEGGIAHLRLNAPERGNPMDLRFCEEFSRAAAECDETPGVRCVLIDASGSRFFGVGADLKTMNQDRQALQFFVKNATTALHSGLSRFSRMDAPVVVAVHALAVGGFVSLCAMADFCLAAESATFYAGYTGIGLVCDAGGSTFLPRRVGTRRTAEFLLRNQSWNAHTAQAHGLVSEVVADADLSDHAWSLARELAVGPTRAFGEIKNLLLSSLHQPIEAQLEQEARAMGRITRTDDAWHGICTVAQRGKPVFVGR
jgi:2-(1,2-epoxy-1,2-dihydrophenyl)acetyl-CoA isomerase